MNEFTTDKIDLSMCDPDTGMRLTANVYHVDGIYNTNGTPRDLSIGQLVMAICLDRAAELERSIIAQMERMSRVTDDLEALTDIQAGLVDAGEKKLDKDKIKGRYILYSDDGLNVIFDNVTKGNAITSVTCQEFLDFCKAMEIDATLPYDDLIAAFTSKMNSLNSVSQTDMIQLQSLTSKRDQSYDLISNVLKSLHQVLLGTANNV